MLSKLKQLAYFPVAYYFRFWAGIQLSIWRPRIVVVTGSNGKTTALHLIEAQLKDAARYSHHANSSFGIPFDILGLNRVTFHRSEWLKLVLLAPLAAFKKPYPHKIYVVEADCDRPGEGLFLASFLKPEVTVWLSSARTHSQQFDPTVASGKFPNIEQAVAFHFGYFPQFTSQLVIANTDNTLLSGELARSQARIEPISLTHLVGYVLDKNGTSFNFGKESIQLPYLLPREVGYSILAARALVDYFKINFDSSFAGFRLPPGRSSLFVGKKETTIIDSSYNSNLSSATAILNMVKMLNPKPLWLILGDFIEQGSQETQEHNALADLVETIEFNRLILVGPRLQRDVYARLQSKVGEKVVSYVQPVDALRYIEANLAGGETLVFKGARFLEGIVEHLLANPADVAKLCRQELAWKETRKKWGL